MINVGLRRICSPQINKRVRMSQATIQGVKAPRGMLLLREYLSPGLTSPLTMASSTGSGRSR